MAGIYIHIPFCKKACSYCNFYFSTNTSNLVQAILAINTELQQRKNCLKNETIETIYFGGGTPSLASVNNLEAIIKTIYNNYAVVANPEITIEVNPDDIHIDLLKQYLQIGINRLSIGIQSFDNKILKLMNRAHNSAKAKECLELINIAGFTNYSADLIYGNPNQTLEEWQLDVETLLTYKPTHISAYALTIEPKTALEKWIINNSTPAPIPELQNEMYGYLMNTLANNNFNHYEISNWALANLESKHNSSYWQNKNYLGIGPSAHSFNGTTRQWNISNNTKYINGILSNKPNIEMETLTDANLFNEYVMINLRLHKGLDKGFMQSNFKAAWCANTFNILNSIKYKDLIHISDTHMHLTNKGKFFADGIAAACFV